MYRMNVAAAIMLIACFLSSLAFGETVPPQVVQAARAGILNFLHSVPRAELAKCGIPEEFSTEDIELGSPLKIMALNDSGLKGNADQSADLLVQDANMWYVPVVVRGDYVSILTIAFHENEWKAIGLGKAAFSHEIQGALERFSRYSDFGRYILKDYQLESDFLIYQKNKEIYWYPFESAQRALGLSKSDYQQNLPQFRALAVKISEKLQMEEE